MRKILRVLASLLLVSSLGVCTISATNINRGGNKPTSSVSENLTRYDAKQLLLNCENTVDIQKELFVVEHNINTESRYLNKSVVTWAENRKTDLYKTLFMANRGNVNPANSIMMFSMIYTSIVKDKFPMALLERKGLLYIAIAAEADASKYFVFELIPNDRLSTDIKIIGCHKNEFKTNGYTILKEYHSPELN